LILTILVIFTACGNKPAVNAPITSEQQVENNISNEEKNTEEKNSTPKAPNGPEESLLSETYLNIIKTNKYYMKYRMIMEGQETILEMAIDGDNMAIKSTASGVESDMVIKDGKTYVINHAEGTILVLPNEHSDTTIQEPIVAYDNLPISSEGTGNFLGRTLKYEEYDYNGEKIKYYFENEKIVGIESSDDSGKYYIEVLELTKNIPKGMFDLPSDYVLMGMDEL
jgi:hypothetical protein